MRDTGKIQSNEKVKHRHMSIRPLTPRLPQHGPKRKASTPTHEVFDTLVREILGLKEVQLRAEVSGSESNGWK